MRKKEWVYLYIAAKMDKGKDFFTQLEISQDLGIAASTVHNALKPLEKMHAIQKAMQGFRVINKKKFYIYWGTVRRFEEDIVFSTFVDEDIEKIESALPSVTYTAYTAYKLKFNEKPADYSEVYVYGNVHEIKKRFKKRKGPLNLIVLKDDKAIKQLCGEIAPTGLIFADLWNLPHWYAIEFLRALEARI